jgi:hypothetical protein
LARIHLEIKKVGAAHIDRQLIHDDLKNTGGVLAPNVPPQHAAVFGELRFDIAQPMPIKRHQKPLSELFSFS